MEKQRVSSAWWVDSLGACTFSDKRGGVSFWHLHRRAKEQWRKRRSNCDIGWSQFGAIETGKSRWGRISICAATYFGSLTKKDLVVFRAISSKGWLTARSTRCNEHESSMFSRIADTAIGAWMMSFSTSSSPSRTRRTRHASSRPSPPRRVVVTAPLPPSPGKVGIWKPANPCGVWCFAGVRPNTLNFNLHLLKLYKFYIWPHRLTARTPGFHPGNRGSIPREVTIYYINQHTPVATGVCITRADYSNSIYIFARNCPQRHHRHTNYLH